MNSQSLYADFKWKQYLKESAQEREALRIKNLAEVPKINPKSNFILSAKLLEILDQFEDEQIINLQESIPILHKVHILQVLDSLDDIKQKLKTSQQRERIEWQSRFVICLWRLIDEQEIETRQLKQIIFLLHEKKGRQLKEILDEMFNDHDGNQQFMDIWKQLNYNRQYYKRNQQKYDNYEAQKQNNYMNSRKQKIYSPLDKNQSQIYHKQPLGQTNSFLEKGLGYSCFLSSDKEKQLVGRLYKNDKYKNRQEMKKEKDQQKEKEQLQQCTFKPRTNHNRSRSTSQTKKMTNIKGYEKAVGRLRTGNQKTKQKKNLREYKPVGENYEKIKEKGINPPKFLNRKKQEDKVLFMISFDLGRYKTNVKIRQGDSEQGVAEKLCKIYSLKQDYFEEICKIIRNQLEQYYKEQYEKQVYKDYGAQ